jgi:tRNA 2-selenouridine synthase
MVIHPRTLSTSEFLDEADRGGIILDVRSPSEFTEGHIAGARSWPLFDDLERAEIGTLYKQKSREQAIDLGLELIGPRMVEMARYARNLFEAQTDADGNPTRNSLLIHCWRGGMRSESVAWLVRAAGVPAVVLEGGYKAYRTFARAQFDRHINFAVLGGLTGSAKTEVLHELDKLPGESVIDLEGIAKHFGSAFGNLEEHPQPTSKQLSNDLFAVLRDLNAWGDKGERTRPIWIENESRSIGRVDMPEPIFSQMISSNCYEMQRTNKDRVDHLVGMYGEIDTSLLATAFEKIAPKLGGDNAQEALAALEVGNLARAAEIALVYYDKTYAHGLKKRSGGKRIEVDCKGLTPAQCADHLSKFLTDYLKNI